MHKTRLRMLVKMLRNHDKIFQAPRKKKKIKFNISFWYGTEGIEVNKCGTVACAVGSACLYKPFNDLGLELSFEAPLYKDQRGWHAVHDFFKIGDKESQFLFSQKHYLISGFCHVNAKDVANRIEKFIASGGKMRK